MKSEDLYEGCDIWNLIEEIDQEKDSFEEYMETLSDIDREELQEFILMLSEDFEDDSINEFFFKFVENNDLDTKALNEIFDFVIQKNESLTKAIAKGIGKAALSGVKAATAGRAQDFIRSTASKAKSGITKTKEYQKFKQKRSEKRKVKDARKSAIRKAKTRTRRLKSVARGRARQSSRKTR